jgi:hypothetical protein
MFTMLQMLNSELLNHDSATLTLERWWERRLLKPPTRVTAERVYGDEKIPTPEQRQLLMVGLDELVLYRRVRLKCAGCVLSEADNWYVPTRLKTEMIRQLDTTDVAFGRVVQSLHFRRQTISAKLLWAPASSGCEVGPSMDADANARPCVPSQALEHRGILRLPDGTPFSAVIETYMSTTLGMQST